MEPNKRTQGKWIVADFGEDVAIKEASLMVDGKWMFADRICTMGNYPNNKENASFICQAVNNYSSLLDALKDAYAELKFHNWHNTTTGYKINEAIKAAESND